MGELSGQSERHPQSYTALYWHLGRYGRQDVHVHSCFDHADRERPCHHVLIGPGRKCDHERATHWPEVLRG